MHQIGPIADAEQSAQYGLESGISVGTILENKVEDQTIPLAEHNDVVLKYFGSDVDKGIISSLPPLESRNRESNKDSGELPEKNKDSGDSVGAVLEKNDEDQTMYFGANRDAIPQKCGSDVADEGVIIDSLTWNEEQGKYFTVVGKKDEDQRKFFRGDRDVILQKCGSDVADGRVITNSLTSNEDQTKCFGEDMDVILHRCGNDVTDGAVITNSLISNEDQTKCYAVLEKKHEDQTNCFEGNRGVILQKGANDVTDGGVITDSLTSDEDQTKCFALEKKDEDQTKCFGGDRDVILQKCGCDVSDGGIITNSPTSKCCRDWNKDSVDGCDEAERLNVHKITSCEVQVTRPAISSKSIENKVSVVGYGNREADVKSEKGFVPRERRKSKYLSPPYINVSLGRNSSPSSAENETDDPKAVSHVGVDKNSSSGPSKASAPVRKGSSRKRKKKLSRKHITWHDIFGKSKEADSSSAKMLSELRFTALDCLYPDDNINFHVVESFFSGFRRSVFRDHICEFEHAAGQDVNNETHLFQNLSEVEVQMEIGVGMQEVTSEHSGTKLAARAPDVSKASNYTGLSQPLQNVGPKRRGKKKVGITSLGDWKGYTTSNGSVIINFEKTGCPAPDGQHVLKKREKKAEATPQTEVMAGLSDLNGNNIGGAHGTGGVATQEVKPAPKRGKRKDGTNSMDAKTKNTIGLPDENGSVTENGPFFKDVQVMSPHSLQSTPELNHRDGVRVAASMHLNAEITAKQPDVNGNQNGEYRSFVKDKLQMSMLASGGKPEHKKRKRKEKVLDHLAKVTSEVPDLNGIDNEPRLVGNKSAETNCISPEGNLQRKRGRRDKATAVMSEINFDYVKQQNEEEASGSALLLKFCPEFPMPSKEALVSAFSGFGELNESETQVFSEFSGAQVVFTRGYDAREAFRSLEKSSPFGPSLVNYRLHHLSASEQTVSPQNPKSPGEPMIPLAKPKDPSKPCGLKPHSGEAPDLLFVRQNLEMMTSTLEKAGDTLSPEMRAKLESGIKSLMNKVGTMVGSSSSSS